MVVAETVDLREGLRPSINVNTSEVCSFIREPSAYGQVFWVPDIEQTTTNTAVRRFLAACRLHTGERGRESLGSIGKLWKNYPKILAEGDGRFPFFLPDSELARLMTDLKTTSRVSPFALQSFLNLNKAFGRKVTPLRYTVMIDSQALKVREIRFSDLIDSVDQTGRDGKGAVAMIVETADLCNRKDLDGALALKLFMAKMACEQSGIIGGRAVDVRVWGIPSQSCFRLEECDEQMALQLARRAAWAMRLGIKDIEVIREPTIRFNNTCKWSRVITG